MTDKEVGEALETIARDLSYRFPISTFDAYAQLCGNMRALEDAIEQRAILGVTPQIMMLRFIRGGIQNTQVEGTDADIELDPEAEAKMWRENCGKLNVQLQDKQHKRAYYQQGYYEMKRALKTLLQFAERKDPYADRP